MSRPLAIVDIDGVVADVRHRLVHLDRRPKDWDAFFAAAADDTVHSEGAAVVARLAKDHDVVFVTGRPSRLRDVTTTWLEDNGFGEHRLVMRADDDRRPAAVVKLELIRDLAAGRDVAVVVDDEPAVLAAVRAAGLPAFAAEWERR